MKHLGDYAELKFTVRAFEQGYAVLRPFSARPYDFVLEKNGNFLRVQVKSTSLALQKSGRFPVTIRYGSSPKRKYTREHCDAIAIYIKALDMFYLIPIDFITSVRLSLYPLRPKYRFNEFKENWSI